MPSVTFHVADGDRVVPNQRLFTLSGNARLLLTAERTALNFVQSLSGIATITAQYSEQLADTKCQLLDTRKTLPLWRAASKYAVTCGGGHNHRFGLFDVFLVKENHIAACGGIAAAVAAARAIASDKKIEVEVENLDQLTQAISAKVDVAMLDNFTLTQVEQAVALTAGRIGLEVSGNVSLQNIRAYALTGINYISVGALTKHIRAIDLSMRFDESASLPQ